MPCAELPTSENPIPPLTVKNLTKGYGEEPVIDRVTFSATAGEVLGIIGPNGAGKTTLLEAVVGLLAADSGEVFWHGEPLPASQRRNALLFTCLMACALIGKRRPPRWCLFLLASTGD